MMFFFFPSAGKPVKKPVLKTGRSVFLLIILLGAIVGYRGWALQVSEDTGSCFSCHRETWDREVLQPYVHAPFAEKQCSRCHGGEVAAAEKSEPVVDDIRNLRWLRHDRALASEHWLSLPADRVSPVLWIETVAADKEKAMQSLALPPLDSLPVLVNDHEGPQISDVVVRAVELGVFVSARITWKTDKFSDSVIPFGVDSFDHQSRKDTYLRREHEVILSGLDRDRTYRFRAVSEDIHGNRTASDVLAFSTERAFVDEEDRASNPADFNAKMGVMNHTLYRAGDEYLLQLAFDVPVAVSLAVEARSHRSRTQNMSSDLEKTDSGHPLVQGGVALNIQVCYTCHAQIQGAMSHPVGIYPPPGMHIPAEYPLLPDGRISCMSCHNKHGSGLPYRLIKSSRKELCVGCHVNY